MIVVIGCVLFAESKQPANLTVHIRTVHAIKIENNHRQRYYRSMRAKACETLSEKSLESYLMNLLPAQINGSIFDDSVTTIENHLLICSKCLRFAESHDALINALRAQRRQSQGSTVGVGQTFGYHSSQEF